MKWITLSNQFTDVVDNVLSTQMKYLHITSDSIHTKGESIHTTGESIHTTGESIHTTGESIHTTGESIHTTGVYPCHRWVHLHNVIQLTTPNHSIHWQVTVLSPPRHCKHLTSVSHRWAEANKHKKPQKIQVTKSNAECIARHGEKDVEIN